MARPSARQRGLGERSGAAFPVSGLPRLPDAVGRCPTTSHGNARSILPRYVRRIERYTGRTAAGSRRAGTGRRSVSRAAAGPRRVLMTADTVGGVWTYALDLSAGLGRSGIEVVLATMGRLPPPQQRARRPPLSRPCPREHCARARMDARCRTGFCRVGGVAAGFGPQASPGPRAPQRLCPRGAALAAADSGGRPFLRRDLVARRVAHAAPAGMDGVPGADDARARGRRHRRCAHQRVPPRSRRRTTARCRRAALSTTDARLRTVASHAIRPTSRNSSSPRGGSGTRPRTSLFWMRSRRAWPGRSTWPAMWRAPMIRPN